MRAQRRHAGLRAFLVLLVVRSSTCSLATPPKVVFTDCDGTMLNPAHQLTPRARSTLAKLRSAGVRVVPATGRARAGAWTDAVLTDSGLSNGVPGIYLNGCSVFDADGLVHSTTLDESVVAPVLDFATTVAATPVVYAGEVALVERADALVARLAAVGDSPVERVPDLRAACDGRHVSKVLLLMSDDGGAAAQGIGAARSALAPIVAGRAGLTQALSWAIEVVPLGADKATAALLLLQRWGVSAEAALAIGDGENDVTLLRLCGTSVAMGNACDAAQEAAQHLCAPNDADGWSDAMERFVLGPLAAPRS